MANETSKTTSPGNASSTPQQIPLAQIRDLPGIVNIRTYTPKDLGGLVSSIQSVGVREPIIVRRSEDGMYQLLAGQRRRKASELAKKTTIPALVYEMTLEEARSYHKAQALNPKAVIPGKLVTLSADEPSRSEEKPPAVPAADKDKQNEKPAPTAPIKSDPTKAEEKTPVVPLVADKDKETEKSASVVPAKSEAVKVEEKSAAAPANADKSKEAEKPAAATPAKSEPAKTEGKMSATPAAMDKGKEAEKSAPAASTKAAPAKPAAMPAGPAAVGPTGTAITQVFDARLNPPDEKALKDLPIPKEGESYFITLHPAYLERSKYNNFSVDKDSDNFKELYKAVELTGIKDPVLARPKEGGGLEILSGQRRHLIGTELNYPIPTIIQRIDDADAKILVADSNLHRDIVFNSVSLVDGSKYRSDFKSYFGTLRGTSNAVSRERGLSVIEPKNGKGKSYAQWMAEQDGKPTWRTSIRLDIRDAVAESFTWKQFLEQMKQRGYQWKLNRKYIALKAPGMERYIRLRSLGKNYSEEEIRGQILQPKVKRVYQKAVQIHPKKKLTGIQALYYSYLYQMGVLPKRPKRSPYAVREDIRKLDQRIEQIEFLMKHDITTREQLATYREPLQKQISELMKERRKLYRNDSEDSGKARLSEINEELKNLRKEVRMTVRIEKHSLEIEERLRKAEEQNQNEKRVEHKEKESQEVR